MDLGELCCAAFLTGMTGGLGGCIPLAVLIWVTNWFDRRRGRRERENPPTPRGWGHL